RGRAAGWFAERGVHAAGGGLPVRAGRRDAGLDPLRRPRCRAARSLPHPTGSAYAARRRRGERSMIVAAGGINNSILVVVLASAIFAGAAGLSSYLGNDLGLGDEPARASFHAVLPSGLRTVPVVGPILFNQSLLVYGSWLLTLLVALYLSRARAGLNVRAVGEAPAAADAMGINVPFYRYVHTVVGGALAGIGGACFSLSITPQWVDG